MPPKKSGRFTTLTSWSFSVYTQYIKCPFSVCLEKIQKIRIIEPPNPHFAKGNCAHDLAANCAGGRVGKMPSLKTSVVNPVDGKPIKIDLTSIKDTLVQLRAAPHVAVEQEWAFTKQWKPTGWFDKDAWLRIKTDVCADQPDPPAVDIIDWKTGQVHADDHRLQRRLYAMGGLLLVDLGVLAGGDKKTKLTAQHVYIDTGQTATEEFLMKHLVPLKKEWLARINYMMNDTNYEAKPSAMNCRWCKFNKRAGGPCLKGV